jgi:hypothetical protein
VPQTAEQIAETLSPEAQRVYRELVKVVRDRGPLTERARLGCGLCAAAANALRENAKILERVPDDEGTLEVVAMTEAKLTAESRSLGFGPRDWPAFAMRSCPIEAEVAICRCLGT